MKKNRLLFLSLLTVLVLVTALVIPSAAHGDDTPTIKIGESVLSLDRSIVVPGVYSEGPGWVVIRNDGGRGISPGPVLGFRAVHEGWNYNIKVTIDPTFATAKVFTVLHEDTGAAGEFDFGANDSGADRPVVHDGKPVQVLSALQLIDMDDQPMGDEVVLNNVVTDKAGWLVIHQDNKGTFGGVLGETLVKAGRNRNVTVKLAADGRTDILWPMLHVDTGEKGKYEFGTVKDADGPIVVDGVVASTPVWTTPHVRMADQIVVPGDGGKAAEKPTVNVASALSKGPGFIVIHKDDNGKPGGVAGFAPLTDGTNTNVAVELDPKEVTPVLWPMLHVDTGKEGEYEFGKVEGADGPVVVDGKVLTFPIQAAPSQTFVNQELKDDTITIKSALIDAPGWVAIHVDNKGQPGEVIASYPLVTGWNENIVIKLDPAKAGKSIFPMLHYDTGEIGKYEFGTVKDADVPVFVNKNVIVSQMKLEAEAPAAAAATCTVTPKSDSANLRATASTTGAVAGKLEKGKTANVVGKASVNGNVWFKLEDGSWVRNDVVTAAGDCDKVAEVTPASPEATPEAKK